jgi:hypothetical protein
MGIKLQLRNIVCALLLISLASLTGCTYGILYTSKTSPYSLNFANTPAGISRQTEGAKMVSIPTTYLSAGWNSRAIGEVARRSGLTEIYYADLYTYSMLAGLWENKELRVYGK